MKKPRNEETVTDVLKDEGYTFTGYQFIKGRNVIGFICPQGHEHIITTGSWDRGSRCSVCAGKHITIEDVRHSFNKNRYELLSTEYIKASCKLDFICPNGHRHNISWNNWKKGRRCGVCAGKHYTIEDIRRSFESERYKLLSTEYINCFEKLYFVCSQGHNHSISLANWNFGQRCGKCLHSKLEADMKEYISTFYEDFIENDRSIIINPETGRYLELDVVFPNLNKAIEFNGQYWHGRKETMERDNFKMEECERLGVELLVVQEKNWNNNLESEKHKIRYFIEN